jgi:hypothetical protein
VGEKHQITGCESDQKSKAVINCLSGDRRAIVHLQYTTQTALNTPKRTRAYR